MEAIYTVQGVEERRGAMYTVLDVSMDRAKICLPSVPVQVGDQWHIAIKSKRASVAAGKETVFLGSGWLVSPGLVSIGGLLLRFQDVSATAAVSQGQCTVHITKRAAHVTTRSKRKGSSQ